MINLVRLAAEDVFRELGPGHSEAVYEAAMALEMSWYDGPAISIIRQAPCTIRYKGYPIGVGFIDLLIENRTFVELKAVAKLSPKDVQQVQKYLQHIDLDIQTGLLINFGNDLEIVEVQKGEHGETSSTSN